MQDTVTKREVSSFAKRHASGVAIQKAETHLKIDQDEKIETVVIEVEKEENTKKTLKPHHLYVKSPEELQKMYMKRIQQRDQAKRMKIIREKHNVTREL